MFGAQEGDLGKLQLRRDVDAYFYISQGKASKVSSISDRTDYKSTMAAFRTLDFSTAEVDTIWKIVGAILHLVSVNILLLTEGAEGNYYVGLNIDRISHTTKIEVQKGFSLRLHVLGYCNNV